MSSIQPYAPSTSSPFSRTSRELSRLASSTELAVARTNALGDVETAKLEAIGQVSSRALQGVALVSQLEQQLGQLVPIAVSRLQAIGDMHALASADVVSQLPRRLS